MNIRKALIGTYDPKHQWGETCFLQWGGDGLVIGKDATRRTAFFEAFPENPDTFIRGEGKTVEEAEHDAWADWQRILSCKGHELETRGYKNGAGFCKHCGLFQSGAFEADLRRDEPPGEYELMFEKAKHGDRSDLEEYMGNFPADIEGMKKALEERNNRLWKLSREERSFSEVDEETCYLHLAKQIIEYGQEDDWELYVKCFLCDSERIVAGRQDGGWMFVDEALAKVGMDSFTKMLSGVARDVVAEHHKKLKKRQLNNKLEVVLMLLILVERQKKARGQRQIAPCTPE